VQQQIEELTQKKNDLDPNTSDSWVKDVLSYGGSDTQVHRLQILVWALVLGVIFVNEVCNTLGMPVFSPTLLGLMGIKLGDLYRLQGRHAKVTEPIAKGALRALPLGQVGGYVLDYQYDYGSARCSFSASGRGLL
jgi:hypothetical protein